MKINHKLKIIVYVLLFMAGVYGAYWLITDGINNPFVWMFEGTQAPFLWAAIVLTPIASLIIPLRLPQDIKGLYLYIAISIPVLLVAGWFSYDEKLPTTGIAKFVYSDNEIQRRVNIHQQQDEIRKQIGQIKTEYNKSN